MNGLTPQTVRAHFGSLNECLKIANIKLSKTIYPIMWKKHNIEVAVKKIFKQYKNIKKVELGKILCRKRLCSTKTIRARYGSLDNLVNILGVKFKSSLTDLNTRIGKNEKDILDNIELEKNVIIDRQYSVHKYFVDGYDKENNVVYEIDEEHHKTQRIQDFIRQEQIEKKLGCTFIRIKDGW